MTTRPPEDRLREALHRWTCRRGSPHTYVDRGVPTCEAAASDRALRAVLAASRPAPDTRTEALRKALRSIVDLPTVIPDHPHGGVHPPYLEWRSVADIALAALSETPSEAPPTEPSLDRARLYDAHIAVESCYIQKPDRLTRAYWNKVADAYDRRTEFAREAAEESANSGRSR